MSKGLEALKEIIEVDEAQLTFLNKDKSKRRDIMLHRHWLRERANIIEAELKEKEKQDKILRIIKEKDVDVYGIKNSEDVYDYNSGIENEIDFENRLLTQEEYDLLKEVLL